MDEIGEITEADLDALRARWKLDGVLLAGLRGETLLVRVGNLSTSDALWGVAALVRSIARAQNQPPLALLSALALVIGVQERARKTDKYSAHIAEITPLAAENEPEKKE